MLNTKFCGLMTLNPYTWRDGVEEALGIESKVCVEYKVYAHSLERRTFAVG